ncbi:MAG: periplasmic protein TonB, partial [Rhodospirillaceae bacterium]
HVPDLPLSLSEIDAIRAQIERCWNVPAGARDAGNLIVEIRVQFAPNGQVLSAQIVEDARYQNDRFYRAAADSAKRAVHQCSPIKAPPTKYERWREVRLRFNPQAMLGL